MNDCRPFADGVTSRLTRLLLVDDHETIRRGVRALVEAEGGYRIVGEASDGGEALRLAQELQPNIAIVDYSLPQLNGLDLTSAMKRICPRTAVLFYTMHDRAEIMSDVLRAGVRGFVLKSDPASSLLAALDAVSTGRPYFSPTVLEVLLQAFLESKPEVSTGTLTPRERQVVQQVAEGRLNRQIAAQLGMTVKTVETHRASAMRKLKLRTSAELVRWAIKNNLVQA